ncbi:MAG: mechanosensitive ion channel family protein [Bacteroidetes bacterium]|nr:mechanosensitive ion channel family protein [Bacteroidota bacterium]MBS1740930.1 mechanosensitive ion channel family protein [Bacteroidota bacterium]MBS1776994.1 mechanosensitive ion channel family protein [Bacteroidota bacterium]
MLAIFLKIDVEYIESKIGHEHLSSVLWCVGIVVGTILLRRPLSILLAKLNASIARRFSDKKHGKLFQDLTVKPTEWLLQTLLYYLAINQLNVFLNVVIFRRHHGKQLLEIRISDVADRLFLLLLILFLVLVISRVIEFLFRVQLEKAFANNDRDKEQLFPLVKEVVKLLLWTIGIFWILGSVFNVNIPALITGLGIGGVAIALAAKESVENFFAAFTILTDKPFQIGDNVRLGSLEGKVMRIGFRSTRLRNADGSLYIIPNKQLIGQNLENLTESDTTRISFTFSLKYGIADSVVQKLISDLKSMTKDTVGVVEPIHVVFETFTDERLQLSLNYHLPEPITEGLDAKKIKQSVSLNAYKIVSEYIANNSTDHLPV